VLPSSHHARAGAFKFTSFVLARLYFDRPWAIYEFTLKTFTQRVVNNREEKVKEHMTPEILCSAGDKLGGSTYRNPRDMERIRNSREELGRVMPKACHDALGFQVACEAAQFRWVKVSFIYELAERDGPAPRCQDLPKGTYTDGIVPEDCQPFVVSYPWSSHLHPDPSGRKMKELRKALMLCQAKEEDLVFLDYLSLPQNGEEVPQVYAELNKEAQVDRVPERPGFVRQRERTQGEKKQFKSGLFETTRLYSFVGGKLPNSKEILGCKVLILPKLEDVAEFPDVGQVEWKLNENCTPPRMEQLSNWGFSKSVPYERGGWTCAEYSVARKSNTIANPKSRAVRRVENSQRWPETVKDYDTLMRENSHNPVIFTKRGDREVVRFNFYKYCYHFLDKE